MKKIICLLDIMELNISELDDNDLDYDYNFDNISVDNYDDLEPIVPINNNTVNTYRDFQQIPENNFYNEVKKKTVRFLEKETSIKPFPKSNSRMVRPPATPLKPQVTYDDILEKMGMYLFNGKLHKTDYNQNQNQNQNQNYIRNNNSNIVNRESFNPGRNSYIQKRMNQSEEPVQDQSGLQNSYIYNKYFKGKEQSEDKVRRPLTLMEYRRMILNDIIQKRRIRQIKSTKLMLPSSNINFSSRNSGDMNKLFNFSRR